MSDPSRASCCPWKGEVVGEEVTFGGSRVVLPWLQAELAQNSVWVASPSLVRNKGLRKS